MGSLIAGIVVAAVAGIAALGSTLSGDEQARSKLAAERNYVDEMYNLNKKDADEKFAQAKEQAERNAKQAELEADLTDKSLNLAEKGLSQDFNAEIDNLYLGQQSDALNWNMASMQAGSSEGAAYANLAASGVRAGSSLSDAVMMESAVNENQLQFAQDTKRRSDSNNLAGVLSNLAGNRFGIEQNRIGADITRSDASYLRNSYLEGGHNYNLYQNQLQSLKKEKDYKQSQIDLEYEQHSGSNAFWNSVIALHTGSARGFNTGYNMGETFKNASNPNYSVTVGGK